MAKPSRLYMAFAPTNTTHPCRVFPVMTSDAVVWSAPVEVQLTDATERLAVLFDTHHPRLYRLARRLSKNAEDARDLVQETYLRAAQSIGSVPSGATREEAWLVRVLINICRDGWRRAAVRQRHDLVHAAEAALQGWPDQERELVARSTVWRALDALTPRRRAIVVLYEIEGAGIADIAALLGVAPVTVRWHLSRGRRDLARAVRHDEV
jgi:RNA polymerase sigma factor (sigma-70 family)